MSDQPNNQLQLIDLRQRKLVGHVDLGESPEGVSISPDGRWVVAAVEESNDIVITDTGTNKLAFAINVHGRNPEHAVFSPDGRNILVSAEEGGAVDVIDFVARKQVAQVSVGACSRGSGFCLTVRADWCILTIAKAVSPFRGQEKSGNQPRDNLSPTGPSVP